MREIRHPLNGALYGLEEGGLVRVEKAGRVGHFDRDGGWRSGELRSADPELCRWIASANGKAPRRHVEGNRGGDPV